MEWASWSLTTETRTWNGKDIDVVVLSFWKALAELKNGGRAQKKGVDWHAQECVKLLANVFSFLYFKHSGIEHTQFGCSH